jgi:DeoR/GlpR family transcriptional regulator of sugar metabolism
MNERQKRIVEILAENANASVNMLSEKLKVSGVTIRHDLNFLENEGLLKRVHGGAVLRDADDMEIRLSVNFEIKQKIARKAADQVDPGETVLIESGSINALLARELVLKEDVTLITSNVYIARQFRNNRNVNIIVLGGVYQPVSESMIGKLAKMGIDQLHFSKAFIGIDGFTKEAGFTSRDIFRSEISAHIVEKCKDTYIVTDSSKFGKLELTTICLPDKIQFVITDSSLQDYYRNLLKEHRVEVIYC